MIFLTCHAQDNVKYDIDPTIKEIQNSYISAWEDIDEIDGYRIRILSVSGSNSKARAEKALNQFTTEFPDIPAYLTFAEPNFQIHVGNFQTRLQAYKVLLLIQPTYPSAYITTSKIDYHYRNN